MKKLVLKIVLGLAGVYALLILGFFVVMHLPPVQFAAVVAKLPRVSMYVFGPAFPRLWQVARAGSLDVGDAAPDFDLETHDHKGRVRLSSFSGQRPVVLVFGSYT